MEVGSNIAAIKRKYYFRLGMLILFVAMAMPVAAQPTIKKYTVSKGSMQILLGKQLSESELNQFIDQYDLGDLELKKFIRNNFQDSIMKLGWMVEINNDELIVISKPLFSAGNIDDPAERIRFTGSMNFSGDDHHPVPMNNQLVGVNNFRNQRAFTAMDSITIFFLRNNKSARTVKLAGNFTNWSEVALPMQRTDSGWRVPVQLKPGKYLYKFIVDGNWVTDNNNLLTENDTEGNTNSVYFVTNHLFKLATFLNAKNIYLSGSFNNWQKKKLSLKRIPGGWELPAYISDGTYTYRYIVDGNWLPDPTNPAQVPNEFGEMNSLISVGRSTMFQLQGHLNARTVNLAGSFNDWRTFELQMTRSATGWQLPYVLGPGNYEYKFFVDGNWVNALGTPIKNNTPGDILVVDPNYRFRLNAATDVKSVFIAGDFNGWSPNAYPMKKVDGVWILPLHLSPGKHVYKYVVDGNWIKDPGNKLWEENEFGTGNSVLWIK